MYPKENSGLMSLHILLTLNVNKRHNVKFPDFFLFSTLKKQKTKKTTNTGNCCPDHLQHTA